MRYFLVCNPGSSSGRGRRKVEDYRSRLERSGADFTCRYTKGLDDAARLARAAAASGYGAVVAVGGDGTINRVLNGLMGMRGPLSPKMGVLYSGTSPDFCRFHGLPTDPAAAVSVLLEGRARPIDVCRMEHGDRRGRQAVSYFACSANLGLGAGIAGRSNRYRAYLGDFLGTLLATVVTVARARPAAIELIMDGRRLRVDRAINVTIGKNPHLASGLKLDIDALSDDGRAFVFAVGGLGKLAFLRALPAVYSGSIARDGRFAVHWAACVRARCGRADVEAEADGDPAGLCPVEIRVLPRAVHLIGARR